MMPVRQAPSLRRAFVLPKKLLAWADMVFVMEKRHKERLFAQFGDLANEKQIVVLDIPDEYQYMDEELVGMLEEAVVPYLNC